MDDAVDDATESTSEPVASRRWWRGPWAVIGAGVLAVVVAAGAGASWWYFKSGDQPAQALPASTVAYLSIDLDPSGQQKPAVRSLLEKFPAWESIGSDDVADIREKAFGWLLDDTGCADVDYDDQIEPWLGSRAAVAVVPRRGDKVDLVFAIQHRDADEAESGLETLRSCSGEGDEFGGWDVGDDWLILAENEKIAKRVANAAADAPLSDDDALQEMTSAGGGHGLVNLYVAADAGDRLAGVLVGEGELPPGSEDVLSGQFPAFATTLRASDGDVELTGVTEGGGDALMSGGSGVDSLVSSLPDSTAAAVGVSFEKGWAKALLKQIRDTGAAVDGPQGASELDDFLSTMREVFGQPLPKAVEGLFGRATVLALEDDEKALLSARPTLALKVRGDSAAAERSLDGLRRLDVVPAGWLASGRSGDDLVIGPNKGYRKKVIAGGGLGESDSYRRVLPDAESAHALLFVNLDATMFDSLLDTLREEEPDVAENLDPLVALGLSQWQEDGRQHFRAWLAVD